MSEFESITLKNFNSVGTGKGPIGRNRKFDGLNFSFAPDEKIIEIVEVRAGRTSFSPPRKELGTGYSFNGKTITLLGSSQLHIKVEFVREVSQEEFEASAPPQLVEFQQKLLASFGTPAKAAVENAKIKNKLGNSSVFNNPGEIFGGFKGLSAGAKPTKDFVDRCRPALLLEGAADGSADKQSAQTTNLSNLFKKTNMKTQNLNKVVICQGSRAEIQDELKKNTTLNTGKLKAEMQKILPAGLTSKIIRKAEEQTTDKQLGKTPQDNITTKQVEVISARAKQLLNAGFNLNPKGLMPAAGRTGSNIFANFLGKVKNITSGSSPDITKALKGIPEGVVPPAGTTVPNLIEGTNELTGKISVNTNTNKLVDKGSLIPTTVAPTNVSKIGVGKSAWDGFNTRSANYEFEIVETLDELRDEFENSQRCQAINENAISVCVVSWTTDELWPMDAGQMHEAYRDNDLEEKIQAQIDNGKSATEAAALARLDLEKLNSKIAGIQPHYIIRPDGVIQRGRPIDEVRDQSYDPFGLNGVNVAVVAGQKNPPNAEQALQLENFLGVLYQALPGCSILGDYEIFPDYLGPGLDVAAIRDKFGKVNLINNPDLIVGGEEVPSRKELAFVIPDEVAKTTKTANKEVEAFSFNKLAEKFERIDEVTGEELPPDLEKDTADMKDALAKIQSGEIDIQDNINNSFAKGKDDLAKQIGESNVQSISKIKDSFAGKFDKNLSNLKVGGIDKITSNIKNIFGG